MPQGRGVRHGLFSWYARAIGVDGAARLWYSVRVQETGDISAHGACTVVVCSCDKYADLLRPFIMLFRKFWPDCPFEVVLVTETAPEALPFDRVVALGPGGTWCSRLAAALEQVGSPHVLMLCDDYYLESPVDTALILRRLQTARAENALNLRLIPNPKRGIPRGEGLMEYPKDTAYCIATQAGIWDRAFLKGLAERTASIWEFERYGSFSVGGETRPILATVVREFPFVDAVHKGHWEKFGVAVCRTNGIEIDFSKRGLPPWTVRVKEACKALVFAVFPHTWIVRVQNLLHAGMKERK